MNLYLCTAKDILVQIAYIDRDLGGVWEEEDLGALVAAQTSGRAKTLFLEANKQDSYLEYVDIRVRCVAKGVTWPTEGLDHDYTFWKDDTIITMTECEARLEAEGE